MAAGKLPGRTVRRQAATGQQGGHHAGRHLATLFCGLAAMLVALAPAAGQEFSGFARVRDDGLLTVSDYLVRLYGIYVPPTDQTCYNFIRPSPCGSRAALALDFRIAGDFVHCFPRAAYNDGSLVASCSVGQQDLSEWMLQKGWALALPDAPFEYTALERIARSRGVGVWGIPIDTFGPRVPHVR
jgi:endonuclease YncB( thermonuclease family)